MPNRITFVHARLLIRMLHYSRYASMISIIDSRFILACYFQGDELYIGRLHVPDIDSPSEVALMNLFKNNDDKKYSTKRLCLLKYKSNNHVI